MRNLILEGVRAKHPYGYYMTGLWKPHVYPGTMGVRITRNVFSVVVWQEYVGGGEFYGSDGPYAYWLRIPDKCLEHVPLEEAMIAISKNEKASKYLEEKKGEINALGQEADRIKEALDYIFSICVSERDAIQIIDAAYNRDKLARAKSIFEFGDLEGKDFHSDDFKNWGWERHIEAVFGG